jgi:hypothetical protein
MLLRFENELNAKIFFQNEPYFRKLEGLVEEDEIHLGNTERINKRWKDFIQNKFSESQNGFLF